MRRLILLSVTALALCTVSSHAALSQAQAPHAAVVALVPFGPPGNTDYQLDNATNDFSKRLTAKGFEPTTTKAMDPMDVASSAADLCKQYNATAIFAGTVRHEQTHNVFWGTFPTHAEVRVTELGCDGKVKWKGVGTADKTQYWSNPAAAVTNVSQMALDQIIGEMPA